MKNAAGEDHGVAERLAEATQRRLLLPAPGQQQTGPGHVSAQVRKGLEQEPEAFVVIEGPEVAEREASIEAVPRGQVVRARHRLERVGVHAVRDHDHASPIHVARDQLLAHALADDGDAIGALEEIGLEGSDQAIAARSLAELPLVHGRVFPERAGFVHDGKVEMTGRPQRGQAVQPGSARE